MLVRLLTRAGLLSGIGAAALALVLAASGAARSEAGTAVVCGPADARTVTSDSVARVFAQHKQVYGCAQGGQATYRLGRVSRAFGRNRVGPVVLAGTVAAYGLTSSGVDTISAQVVVRQLTDGQVLHRRNAISGGLPAEFYEHVDAIVVKDNGSVAWTADGGSIVSHQGHKVQVEKADETSQTVLDRHGNIRLRSLRLNGSQLTWRDGSTTRSATLH